MRRLVTLLALTACGPRVKTIDCRTTQSAECALAGEVDCLITRPIVVCERLCIEVSPDPSWCVTEATVR